MRLITKSILYYLLISLPLLIIAGFVSYHTISTEVREGTDEAMEREKQNAIQLVHESEPLANFYLSSDSLSLIQPLSAAHTDACHTHDTTLFDRIEKEKNDYRVLQCYYTSNAKTYLIQLVKPLFEEEELVEGLVSSLFLVLAFLVAAFFIMNWLLSKTLWRPFNKTIQTLNNYSLANHSELQLEQTNIKEFQYLNAALAKMTDKIHRDYLQQKEFTENASHELQTPLAIIRASVDNLFQSQHLKEEELNQLQTIEKAIHKLASLNKALLLLTKIENNQFKETQAVNLSELASHLLDDYGSLYAAKHIVLHKKLHSSKSILINPLLAELLVGNLVKNAFKHNAPNGHITVEVTDAYFSVSNTGEAMHMDKENLFNRFKKNDAASDSLGLGLAIVKSIVKLYGYKVSYDYKNNRHFFTIRFD